jgi:hypothetical protein
MTRAWTRMVALMFAPRSHVALFRRIDGIEFGRWF